MYDLLKGANHGRKMTGGKSKARIQIRVKTTEKYETIKDPLKNGRRSEVMLARGLEEEETVGNSAEQQHESSSASSFVSFDRDFLSVSSSFLFAPPLLGNLGSIYQTLARLNL
jgi:hypothetical protein